MQRILTGLAGPWASPALRPLLVVLFGGLPLTCPEWAALPADVAAEADAAGCRVGLAVVVGSSDGAAEVALAAGGQRLVQGLARDEASLTAARATIGAHGFYGLASVIRPLSLATLPYADGLVDLLVVDADRLGAAAPPGDEILRVVAPRGLVLTHRGGRWSRSVKPRSPCADGGAGTSAAGGSGQAASGRRCRRDGGLAGLRVTGLVILLFLPSRAKLPDTDDRRIRCP